MSTIPIYNMADTWNAIGTTFNGIYMNFTDGAGGAPVGAADSRLLKLDSDGVEVFSVDAAANIRLATGGDFIIGPSDFVANSVQIFIGNAAANLTLSDTALARNSAGVLEVNNGTPGAFRDLTVRNLVADTALRVNQAPTANASAATTITNGADSNVNLGHRASFNMNGVTYWFPCGSVAF